MDALRFGAPIGLSDVPQSQDARNHPSANDDEKVVSADLEAEVEAGRMLVFDKRPEPLFVSPIGLVAKAGSTKLRRIFDGRGLNEFIQQSKQKYITFDSVVDMIRACGVGCLVAKLDVKSAFRCIPVHPRDRWALGMKWHGRWYVDKVLPFGLASSPSLWEDFAIALEWVLHQRGVKFVCHYVDDFIFAGAAGTDECTRAVALALEVFKELGVPVSIEKMAKEGTPTTTATVLGIEVDTINMTARLDANKLADFVKMLTEWRSGPATRTRHELQQLLGKLNWATAVVPAGRAFLRRLLNVLRGLTKPLVPVTIDAEARADVRWWLKYIKSWNGTSMMLTGPRVTAPDAKLDGSTAVIHTDACETGYGAALNETQWIASRWSNRTIAAAKRAKKLSMPYLELLAVTMAVCTWKDRLRGRRVTIRSDCMPAVQAINGLKSADTQMMQLVRTLLWCAATKGFALHAQHIAGVDNTIADLLSRSQQVEALERFGSLDRSPTAPGRRPTRIW